MNACKEHFLYEEPVINMENECEIYMIKLQQCKFVKVKQIYDEIKKQFMKE